MHVRFELENPRASAMYVYMWRSYLDQQLNCPSVWLTDCLTFLPPFVECQLFFLFNEKASESSSSVQSFKFIIHRTLSWFSMTIPYDVWFIHQQSSATLNLKPPLVPIITWLPIWSSSLLKYIIEQQFTHDTQNLKKIMKALEPLQTKYTANCDC